MIDQLDVNETTRAWLDITIKEFQAKIVKYKIGEYDPSKKSLAELAEYGRLQDSFVDHIYSSAGGDVQKIEISFWYWGAMVDMGVSGRRSKNWAGRSSRQRGSKPVVYRKKKPWYNKTMEREVFQLGRILHAKYGMKSVNVILQELPLKIEINIGE
jgi:hypothetical protein